MCFAWSLIYWMNTLNLFTRSAFGAGEFGSTHRLSTRSRHIVHRLFRLGRIDLLSRSWVGRFRCMSSICIPPSCGEQLLLPHDPDEVRKRPHKRLPDACRAYGIPGWERIDKEAMSKGIGEGRWRNYGRELVFEYCEEDVRASALLFAKQLHGHNWLPPANVELCLSLVELRGKGCRANSSPRHADRYADVEFGAEVQGRRHWRIAAAIRPQP